MRRLSANILGLCLVVGAACSGDDDGGSASSTSDARPTGSASVDAAGAPAVWGVDPGNLPDSTSTSFTALVRRTGCSSGGTGTVLEPVVEAGTHVVVVTFSAEPIPPGPQLCAGNDAVPAVVELDDPIGDRRLIDGACTDPPAEGTVWCQPDSIRWPADPAGFPEDRARLSPS